MCRWRVTIQTWPYSGVDQKLAGEREQTKEFRAGDAKEAMEKAELWREGVETNPAVWMAPMQKLEKISD